MRRAKLFVRQWVMAVAKRFRVPVRQSTGLSAISADDLEQVHKHFSRRKFFILGYPRSGTTLLGRLIRLHPEVDCNWQAHFFVEQTGLADLIADEAVDDWLKRPDNRWTNETVSAVHLVRVACDFIMERAAEDSGAWIVGDKSADAQSYLRLAMLLRVFPDGWVIQIVRDGRDVAVSRRFQQFIDLPGTMSAQDRRIANRLKSDNGAGGRFSIFTPSWLESEAREWATDVMRTQSEGSASYGDRFLSLKYEDLLEAPEETMGRVWSFLGVLDPLAVKPEVIAEEMARNPVAEWHAEVAPSLVGGLVRGRHGTWRPSFTEDDRARFTAAGGAALEYWGYSL